MIIAIIIGWILTLGLAYKMGQYDPAPDTTYVKDDRYHISHLLRELRVLQRAHVRTLRKMYMYKDWAYKHGYQPERKNVNNNQARQTNPNATNGAKGVSSSVAG